MTFVGTHGAEESREGAGVKVQLVTTRVSPEVAAAHPWGGGAVLQYQEAKCWTAAPGGQRRGKHVKSWRVMPFCLKYIVIMLQSL